MIPDSPETSETLEEAQRNARRRQRVLTALQTLRPIPPGLTTSVLTRYLHGPGWIEDEQAQVQLDLNDLVRWDVVKTDGTHYRATEVTP